MKRELVCLTIGIALAGVLGTGCESHRHYATVSTTPTPTGEIIVTEAPPAPRTEVVGVAPSPAHVWVKGYYVYQNGRYVWLPGHWETRPRSGAIYVAGHWDRTSRGWVWTPGHWE